MIKSDFYSQGFYGEHQRPDIRRRLNLRLRSLRWSPPLAACAAIHRPAAAEGIASTCLAQQVKAKDATITVAVLDNGGIVMVVKRQDRDCKAGVQVHEMKARSAAPFNLTMSTLEPLSYGEKKDGAGVSGASGDEDERCAMAGITGEKDLIK